MSITPSDAERILARKLEAEVADLNEREEIIRELARYGELEHEGEIPRVRLAIIKGAGMNLTEIRELVEAAKTDYRDVLSWAEYPNQVNIWNKTISEQELRRLQALDLEQYEQWLAK
ncbi:MAG: hypothetical protein KDA54_09370 [Phycisphaerales bacterium]|nr:hypothetical protein [Phycisphaerales bacterium]